MLLIYFILSVGHLILTGLWLGSVFQAWGWQPITGRQYFWIAANAALGLYFMISLVGIAGGVR